MSLLERVRQAETCRVVDCDRHRAPDALVCADDLTELWRNRLTRQPDGTFTRRRAFAARDLTRQVIAA